MSLQDVSNLKLATNTLEAFLRRGVTSGDDSKVAADMPAVIESFADESVHSIEDAVSIAPLALHVEEIMCGHSHTSCFHSATCVLSSPWIAS